MAKEKTINLDEFVKLIVDLLKSDRDNNIAVGGMTGEGKSCFVTQLVKKYCHITKFKFSFQMMTWSRKELKTWIEGDKKGQGQKPEYSPIIPDELFAMFYKRNWYDDAQKELISILNMCRDRHLLLIGNVPLFWDLDSGFSSRMRFYIYIPRRGVAWIFEQENNPFSKDPWNIAENRKIFRKYGAPYKMPNFYMECYYSDWSEDEKKRYYNIRNTKRVKAQEDIKKNKVEPYGNIKTQRDILLRMIISMDKTLTNKGLGQAIGLSEEGVRLARHGLR